MPRWSRIYRGYIYRGLESDEYIDNGDIYKLTVKEMQEMIPEMKDLPIGNEHFTNPPIGRIVRVFIKGHDALCDFQLDLDTREGVIYAAYMQKGTVDLSLSHQVRLYADGRKVLVPLEVSLCREGRREGCSTLRQQPPVDMMDVNASHYVFASAATHQYRTTTTTRVIEMAETTAVPMSDADVLAVATETAAASETKVTPPPEPEAKPIGLHPDGPPTKRARTVTVEDMEYEKELLAKASAAQKLIDDANARVAECDRRERLTELNELKKKNAAVAALWKGTDIMTTQGINDKSTKDDIARCSSLLDQFHQSGLKKKEEEDQMRLEQQLAPQRDMLAMWNNQRSARQHQLQSVLSAPLPTLSTQSTANASSLQPAAATPSTDIVVNASTVAAGREIASGLLELTQVDASGTSMFEKLTPDMQEVFAPYVDQIGQGDAGIVRCSTLAREGLDIANNFMDVIKRQRANMKDLPRTYASMSVHCGLDSTNVLHWQPAGLVSHRVK